MLWYEIMAHYKSAAHADHSQLTKTSSIFDVFQQKLARMPGGQSTTSFTYEPANGEDKIVAIRRAIFEPTYRLEPRARFKPYAVTRIINQTLQDFLGGETTPFYKPVRTHYRLVE